MIPVKIHMQDFLSYEDETFDFSNIQSATVIGKNGAGKSSFCTDAITWALFGQGSKGGLTERANYVRRGANSCLVEFTFEMSGNLYKVVRNYNSSNKKSSLVLFGYTSAGDEVPLSEGAVEAQKRIVSLLRMTYEVFTAASIVLQNQIHAFTEGMKDSDKKATLLSILNVNIWDAYLKRNSDALKKLKSELDQTTGKLRVAEEAVAKEDDAKAALDAARAELGKATTAKKNAKIKADTFANILSATKAREDSLRSLRDLIKGKTDAAKLREDAQKNALGEAEEAKAQQASIASQLEKVMKIIDHGDEIRSAVEEEKALVKSLEEMNTVKGQYDVSVRNLDNLKKMGKNWNDTHTRTLATLQSRLDDRMKQASLVQTVPCFNTDISPKCPLLSMAYSAMNEAEKIRAELAAENQAVNPYREQWAEEEKNRRSLAEQFSDERISAAATRLDEVRRYSVLLPRLEAANEQVASLNEMLEKAKSTEATKSAEAEKAGQDVAALRAEIDTLSAELSEKNNGNTLAVDEANYTVASNELTRAEAAERTAGDAVARAEAAIERVAGEKERVKELQQEIARLEEEKDLLDVFSTACNKVSGVPAFMVAAATPELEANANAVLERMMDGRLQIRFRTNKDGDDAVGNQFRIEVMEMSEVEPREFSTFSGAEKFIIALAIRIAMGQFLAHRAGASVQLFVLDEGVSCADEDNREEIIRALRNIADDFAKVLFITHDEELKDSLQSKIIVSKDSTGSHLSLVA